MKNNCQTISITIPILKISKSATNYVHDIFKAQRANPKSGFKGGGNGTIYWENIIFENEVY